MTEPRYLQVHSTFESISGEVGGFPQGARAFFVRLAGCNLRCPYCDTLESLTHAYSQKTAIEDLLLIILDSGIDNVVITGGEPLLQSEHVLNLCYLLGKMNKTVTIETNGTLNVSPQFFNMAWVTIVMDWKLLKSFQPNRSLFTPLRPIDFIKFVIKDSEDLLKAINIQKNLSEYFSIPPHFAYSPMITEEITVQSLQSTPLIKEILFQWGKHNLNAVLNVQLHKFLNLP